MFSDEGQKSVYPGVRGGEEELSVIEGGGP